jgi:hypothetical protein
MARIGRCAPCPRVGCVVVLIVWIVAVVVGLIVLAVLAYGLFGRIRRLQRTIAAARTTLTPQLAALAPPADDTGRHRNPD